MMRVDPNAALLQALLGPASARAVGGVARFAPEAPAAPLPAAPPPGITPPSNAPMQSVAMLVTIAAATPEERRKAGITQTGEGLSRLEALHKELVAGVVGPQRLLALREWTRRRSRPDDPALAAIMDEVELRILVELAKFDRDETR